MRNKLQENIRKYYLFQFFNSLEFFSPVIVLFWNSKGLNFTQIMLLQSIYSIAVIILELPTGAFADRFGKKLSLTTGSLLFSIGLFLYGFGQNFWHFALFEITVGAGMAFISGADRSFLHENLMSINKGVEFKKIEGRARGLNQIARTVGNIIGGFIGSISLGLSLTATAFSTFTAFLVSLSFYKPKAEVIEAEKTKFIQIIKESLTIIKVNGQILWLVAFFSSFNSLVFTVNWFSQPYLQLLKVPVVFFGIFFALFSLISAIGSFFVERFEKITGNKVFLVLMLTTVSTMFLLSLFPSIYTFLLWSVFSAGLIVNQTIVSEKILLLILFRRGATILSFANLSRRVIYAALGPIIGFMADSFGILTAIQINAVILLITAGGLIIIQPKFNK